MSVANRFTSAHIALMASVWQDPTHTNVDQITDAINAKFASTEGNTVPTLVKKDIIEVTTFLKNQGFKLRNLSESRTMPKEELDNFLAIWNSSDSVAQVAEKMQCTVEEVKKLQMRCRGRKMEMKRMRERINKDDLASALSGIVELKVEEPETTETTEA